MKKLLKRILLAFGILFLVATAGFVIWASNPLGPGEAALSALQSGSGVTVTQARNYIAFQPASAEPATGFLFYPGGRVDYRSYAPALRAIAARGYTVVLAEMPLSLAVFRINAADAILPAFPEVKTWALGGHSLGGAMAARYTFTHPDAARGLVLWASFPASTDNMSEYHLEAVSIYGSEDSAVEGIEAARALLPYGTTFVRIAGGNHAQFGDYGAQPGDKPAQISAAEQQRQIVDATLAFLAELAQP